MVAASDWGAMIGGDGTVRHDAKLYGAGDSAIDPEVLTGDVPGTI